VVFPFIAGNIVSIPAVSYLIENIFGRDSSLTGRLGIFAVFADGMQGHWLWGYGFGNGNPAAERLFGCANAQNAILQWILQAGIPATLLLIVMMMLIFGQLRGIQNRKQLMPLIILVYAYIILGTVETTFNMSFIMWLAIIFIQANAKDIKMSRPEAKA
jgi:O-antigen ligase